MSDFKFRGMSVAENKWVYGWYIKNHIITTFWPETAGSDFWVKAVEVKPETVGQFTGLVDTNGIDIYDGDDVTAPWHWEDPYTINWPTDMYAITEYSLEDELTVVGNCHERKETKE